MRFSYKLEFYNILNHIIKFLAKNKNGASNKVSIYS